MSKATKIWLITAAILTFAGIFIFGGAMTAMGWNFTKLATDKFETNTYEFEGEIKSVDVNCDTADIELLPSTDGKVSVVCYEHKNEKHEATVSEGTLEIKLVQKRKWYEHIGINYKSPKITVYLPEGEYGDFAVKSDTGNVKTYDGFSFDDVDIKVSTGIISIGDLSCATLSLKTSTGAVKVENTVCTGDVSIKVSTGKTTLSDVNCNSLSSKGDTGSITLKNVIAKKKLSVERSTGNVTLDGSDAGEIYIKTDTGSVRGTLLSDKIFFAESDTGSVKVPKTTSGGKCEIVTDTGNIKIEIE